MCTFKMKLSTILHALRFCCVEYDLKQIKKPRPSFLHRYLAFFQYFWKLHEWHMEEFGHLLQGRDRSF